MPVIIGDANSPLDPGPNVPAGTPLIGYDNVISEGSLTSTTAQAGFPITNIANPATHLVWKGGVNTGDELITITPASGPIDYIAIAGHNFGSSQIPVTITDTGSSPPATLVSTVQVTDDKPIIFRIPSGNYTQLQIKLNLDSVPDDGSPRIAAMYAGRLLVLERGIKVDVTHIPIPYGRKTSIVNGMSESGNFLGRIVLGESRISRAEFFGFTPTFYRASVDPFLDAAQERPFFWAWAPALYPLETGFAWLTADAQPEVSPDHLRIALTLEMAGIA